MILGFDHNFSILIDIDEKKRGAKFKGTEVCEDHFLTRIRGWKKNPTFSVRKYEDLEGLPVILVVVEKGKVDYLYKICKLELNMNICPNLFFIDGYHISKKFEIL